MTLPTMPGFLRQTFPGNWQVSSIVQACFLFLLQYLWHFIWKNDTKQGYLDLFKWQDAIFRCKTNICGRSTYCSWQVFIIHTFWPYSSFPCENMLPFLNSLLAVSKFSWWKGMERKRLNDFFATLKTKPGWLCQPTCSTEGVTSKSCKSCPTRSPSTPTWTRRPPDWTQALEVMAIGGTYLGKWSMGRELCGRETHNNSNLGFSLTLLSRLLYQRSSSRLATVLPAMVLTMLLSQSRYC